MTSTSETRAPEGARERPKPWRLYDVTVPSRWNDGMAYTETVSAPSASAARYQRFLNISDTWPDLTFRQFVGMATVRASSAPPDPSAYDYIRRSYGLAVKHGDRVEIQGEGAGIDGRHGTVVQPSGHTHYVHIVLDGATHAGLFHPGSIRLLTAPETQNEGAARG